MNFKNPLLLIGKRIFVKAVHRCLRYLFDELIDRSLCWLYLRLTLVLANPVGRLNSHGENYINQ